MHPIFESITSTVISPVKKIPIKYVKSEHTAMHFYRSYKGKKLVVSGAQFIDL